ncbi:hypothetical protein EDE15_1256 [Edaphobacter aggregans]|uniref:DUF1440 domain-containing protein n=1 Tax=Edaphobacter aggregans TaxID=570835 RepID=A0A3R9Q9C2_9BACT|nr:hypothetical protein [Edaphobacter aggregans]RSL15754.1 hypothetical protein EDE15_1256 [Edaphobacter aggregans]
MNTVTSTAVLQRPKLLTPILIGGFAAGLFDHLMAVHTFGWGVSRGVASGLLGKAAFQGGMGTWTLGLVLQFFIAISAAAIYCLASLRLRFLRDNWLVCGLFYGIAVYLVMNLIVLPLSAFPFPVGPFKVSTLIQGLLVHMILIGLPISFSLRRFSS